MPGLFTPTAAAAGMAAVFVTVAQQAAPIAAASVFAGIAWCGNDTAGDSARHQPSYLPHHPCNKRDQAHALGFAVDIDLDDTSRYTVSWGTEPSQYVVPQHNATVTPSCILPEDDTLLWMSGDGKGHWWDLDELAEINYWGPPFDLDQGLIDYVTNPNCLWAVYRNYSLSLPLPSSSPRAATAAADAVVSVAKIDSDSMSIIYMFTVEGVNGTGGVALSDSYVNVLVWSEADDAFTLVEKPKSCYAAVAAAASNGHEAPSAGRKPATHNNAVDDRGEAAGHGDDVEALTVHKLATKCDGDVVAVSWPWGWPTNDNLYVVVTRVDENTFHANRYDVGNKTCTVGYEFEFDAGWAGRPDATAEAGDAASAGTDDGDAVTFEWMDSIHALVVHTRHRLFYALPGAGTAAPTTVINITGALAPQPASVMALSSWAY